VYILPYAADVPLLDKTVSYLLLRANNKIYGTLCVAFDHPMRPMEMRLVGACISQAGMALQRIDLAEQVRKGVEVEEADRLKTALLRAVSHDLRTPITIVKTSVSNLLAHHDRLQDDERVEMLKTIEYETDHLDKLVGNLLDMSRLQAGALQLNLALNSLEEVAGDVAAQMWQRTQRTRVELDFPPDMPLNRFDYGLILQALTNLVENSLRYEPEDSRVIIRGAAGEGEARVLVINHGPRIPIEERDQVMKPFFHGTRGNTGLGLPIAHGIVEAHRGTLTIEDTPGRGVTFVIALPLGEGVYSENSRRG
jgi:two-component system, OmpR family, sensor histidine kinase KdpD